MIIRYKKPDGTISQYTLTDRSITMGRSPEADIIILDERASRMHCGVKLWEGNYYIKDLQSKNGTWVNSKRVEMQQLHPGDVIRVGTTEYKLQDEKESKRDAEEVDNSLQAEISSGKGYGTLLREIVGEVKKPGAAASAKPVQVPKPQKPLTPPTKIHKPDADVVEAARAKKLQESFQKSSTMEVKMPPLPGDTVKKDDVDPPEGIIEMAEQDTDDAKANTMPIQGVSEDDKKPKPRIKLGLSDEDLPPDRPRTVRLKKPTQLKLKPKSKPESEE